MTDALELFGLRKGVPRRNRICRKKSGPRQIAATSERALTILPRDNGGDPGAGALQHDVEMRNAAPNELNRLHQSFVQVTPENHPRTARLLASSTRKTAQKVIEEAGEVALEAVKHRSQGTVRESADLLYHLVALWHRAGIDPEDIWTEMRLRADMLGIAEKLPKASSDHRCRPIRNVKPSTKTQQE